MPARSDAQRRVMAIAEHTPSKLYSKYKKLAKLKKSALHHFAATSEKGLPTKLAAELRKKG